VTHYACNCKVLIVELEAYTVFLTRRSIASKAFLHTIGIVLLYAAQGMNSSITDCWSWRYKTNVHPQKANVCTATGSSLLISLQPTQETYLICNAKASLVQRLCWVRFWNFRRVRRGSRSHRLKPEARTVRFNDQVLYDIGIVLHRIYSWLPTRRRACDGVRGDRSVTVHGLQL
jgi:hypothetical protein